MLHPSEVPLPLWLAPINAGTAAATGQEWWQTGYPEWGIVTGFFVVLAILSGWAGWARLRAHPGRRPGPRRD